MHNCHYDDQFFASTYVAGLKEEIRAVVEPHDPATVERATTIAKIQQRTLARNKTKANRNYALQRPQPPKFDQQPQQANFNLQRIRQLRDYRRANNLCYSCGEKYEPGHQAVCPKKQQPQVNALVINDLDKEEITEDMIQHLDEEDNLAATFCQLSLNTLTTVDSSNSIKLRTLVKNKVMLILVDSGSSHSFVSEQFTELAKLPTVQVPARQVKLANGNG